MLIDKNESYWSTTIDPQPPVKRLEGNQEANIAIVGAGLLGVSVAYQLSLLFPSRRIVLLEARRVSNGASGRNGGQVLSGTARATFNFMAGLGYQKGTLPLSHKTLYDKTHFGIELIKDIINEHNLECEFAREGSISFAYTRRDARMLAKYARAAADIGIPVEYIDTDRFREKIDINGYHGGLYHPDTAFINPARYVNGLAQVARDNGAEIFEESPVVKISEGRVCKLNTPEGQINADVIILAANAYLSQLNYFKKRMAPLIHPAGATEPLSPEVLTDIGWNSRLSFHDSSLCVWWAGKTSDNRIVMGGGDNDYRFNGLPNTSEKWVSKYRRIFEKQLKKWFPGLKEVRIEYVWSGSIDATLDLMPAVGCTGEHKNIYYGYGFTGEGVNLAHLCGKIIADIYSGNAEQWQDLPFINRKPIYIPPDPLRYIALKTALPVARLFT